MFTMPIFPRYKEEKRTIITSITQYVVFEIRLPEKRVIMLPNILVKPFGTNMGTNAVITYSEKYIPEEVYALLITGRNKGYICKAISCISTSLMARAVHLHWEV